MRVGDCAASWAASRIALRNTSFIHIEIPAPMLARTARLHNPLIRVGVESAAVAVE